MKKNNIISLGASCHLIKSLTSSDSPSKYSPAQSDYHHSPINYQLRQKELKNLLSL